ncbi:MAG TPA: D-alanyl-D-alanine carboxypeptidase/D-alanyl-D-alanine-endopeptidase [Casimicrobiaceae bacterium]|nr:D-alanyl-D-alanine carboxypeptidase/D-alanyl-D-alanine-endopeptidase [Casimicrobiaceae bacterium]
MRSARVLALALFVQTSLASAQIPRPVAKALSDAGIAQDHVAIVVQRVDATQPLVSHQPDVPMNPASTMKLVTTFAALELLGRDYRWRTEAYLGAPLVDGTLRGDLILKGYGDPKITIEQWQSFMRELRARGLEHIEGDLVLDRTHFRVAKHDPSLFDGEPLRPYNVGPDALLVNFKALRFAFVPNAAGDAVDLAVEPPLPQVAVGNPPLLVDGPCSDWRGQLSAAFINQPRVAAATFPGIYSRNCGARDWYLSLLDHQNYVHGMFSTYFAQAGGTFGGAVRDGRAPAKTTPFAVLESPPLYDIVRDVNKLSNNVMARQVFLTLATTGGQAPPATVEKATAAIERWLTTRALAMPGFAIENGSGLSRTERVTAAGLARLLAVADASAVRNEFATSLAVAATDGTLERRMVNGNAAGQALLKTGSLEGVRALAGYVIDARGVRWITVAIVNHPNAVRATPALDALAEWVYRESGRQTPQRLPHRR